MPRARSSTSARVPAAWPSTWPRPGTRSRRSTRTPALLGELARRAGERGLDIACMAADARRLAPIGPFALVMAPMQFVQILGGASAREEMLAGAVACLRPAASLRRPSPTSTRRWRPRTPRHRCRTWASAAGGSTRASRWTCAPSPAGCAVEWLRQKVSPAGTLTEERHTQMLDSLGPGRARARGGRGTDSSPRRGTRCARPRHYIGSTVVVCRR